MKAADGVLFGGGVDGRGCPGRSGLGLRRRRCRRVCYHCVAVSAKPRNISSCANFLHTSMVKRARLASFDLDEEIGSLVIIRP